MLCVVSAKSLIAFSVSKAAANAFENIQNCSLEEDKTDCHDERSELSSPNLR